MRYHILVVDDEPPIADFVVECIQEQTDIECDIFYAYRSIDALQILKNNRIDLLISDIRMGEFSGLSLLEIVNKQWPHCRTIFLTGYSEFAYAQKALELHAVGYVLKTEPDARLLEVIRDALRGIQDNLNTQLNILSIPDGTESCLLYILAQSNSTLDISKLISLVNGNLNYVMSAKPIDDISAILSCTIPMDLADSILHGRFEYIQSAYSMATNNDISFILERSSQNNEEAIGDLCAIHSQRYLIKNGLPFIYIHNNSTSTKADATIVAYIESYVKHNASNDLSVATLSSDLGYNCDYLSRIYKQLKGITISRLIANEKIKRINDQIRSGQYSLNEISSSNGFSSRSYFNRFVKRETGITPQQLVERIKNEK